MMNRQVALIAATSLLGTRYSLDPKEATDLAEKFLAWLGEGPDSGGFLGVDWKVGQ